RMIARERHAGKRLVGHGHGGVVARTIGTRDIGERIVGNARAAGEEGAKSGCRREPNERPHHHKPLNAPSSSSRGANATCPPFKAALERSVEFDLLKFEAKA